MGVRFAILNGLSSGPAFLFGTERGLRGSSKMSASSSSSSSSRRKYSICMMHHMPSESILGYSRTNSSGITTGSMARLENVATWMSRYSSTFAVTLSIMV